jgi:hypothetical protein
MSQRLVKLKLHVINKILNSCELCSRFKIYKGFGSNVNQDLKIPKH